MQNIGMKIEKQSPYLQKAKSKQCGGRGGATENPFELDGFSRYTRHGLQGPIPIRHAMAIVCIRRLHRVLRPQGLAEHRLHEPLPLGELTERHPAHWTRGLLLQPDADAGCMKRVSTHGQDTQRILFVVVGQAHGASLASIFFRGQA